MALCLTGSLLPGSLGPSELVYKEGTGRLMALIRLGELDDKKSLWQKGRSRDTVWLHLKPQALKPQTRQGSAPKAGVWQKHE